MARRKEREYHNIIRPVCKTFNDIHCAVRAATTLETINELPSPVLERLIKRLRAKKNINFNSVNRVAIDKTHLSNAAFQILFLFVWSAFFCLKNRDTLLICPGRL